MWPWWVMITKEDFSDVSDDTSPTSSEQPGDDILYQGRDISPPPQPLPYLDLTPWVTATLFWISVLLHRLSPLFLIYNDGSDRNLSVIFCNVVCFSNSLTCLIAILKTVIKHYKTFHPWKAMCLCYFYLWPCWCCFTLEKKIISNIFSWKFWWCRRCGGIELEFLLQKSRKYFSNVVLDLSKYMYILFTRY